MEIEVKVERPTQQELYESRKLARELKSECRDMKRRDNPATGNVYAGIMNMRHGG